MVKSMLTDAKLCSSTTAELLVLTLLFEVAATLVAVVCMGATFGRNALSVAIDDKSVVSSTASPPIDATADIAPAEPNAVDEVNGSSVEAVATLTLL